eukprot:TRINITY_DN21577_c0_g1_i1.p1 TRINITY_DN21577_c0_g1~~TRINITY_DN21577_c0_g1_i1.p1  ORF type:complete len:448 (+),score=4.75 TRINITY_DN21577_c0_g1_i1:150-1493(+)
MDGERLFIELPLDVLRIIADFAQAPQLASVSQFLHTHLYSHTFIFGGWEHFLSRSDIVSHNKSDLVSMAVHSKRSRPHCSEMYFPHDIFETTLFPAPRLNHLSLDFDSFRVGGDPGLAELMANVDCGAPDLLSLKLFRLAKISQPIPLVPRQLQHLHVELRYASIANTSAWLRSLFEEGCHLQSLSVDVSSYKINYTVWKEDDGVPPKLSSLRELCLHLQRCKMPNWGPKWICSHLLSDAPLLHKLTLNLANVPCVPFVLPGTLTELSLDLSKSGPGWVFYSALTKALKNCTQLMKLKLCLGRTLAENESPTVLEDFCNGLSSHKELLTLELILWQNYLGQSAATTLAKIPQHCQRLPTLSLDLWRNRLGWNGAQLLAEELQCKPGSLQEVKLDLRHNLVLDTQGLPPVLAPWAANALPVENLSAWHDAYLVFHMVLPVCQQAAQSH